MAYNYEYPYTDPSIYNDDWLIAQVVSLAEQWKTVQTDWKDQQAAFDSLKSYIMDYFNNLDVQDEINVKLNQMVADGTLSVIISAIIGTGEPKVVSSISQMTNTASNYILSGNYHLYYYNGSAWQDSGMVYGNGVYYRPSGLVIGMGTGGITDANDAENGVCYFVSNASTPARLANLPEYGVFSVLVTLNHASNNTHGKMQLYVTPKALYSRMEYGSDTQSTWTPWQSFLNNGYRASNILVNTGGILSDANDAENGVCYFLTNAVTEAITANLPEYRAFSVLVTFNYSTEASHGKMQIYVTPKGLYSRMEYGSDTQSTWTPWSSYLNSDNILGPNIGTFKTYMSIGDSLSVGYHTTKSGQIIDMDLESSWGGFLEKEYGCQYIASGISGATSKSWLQETGSTWGKNFLLAEDRQPLYIYCMGANESSIPIGTIADINTSADTLYRYVNEVITTIHSYAPDAVILVTGVCRDVNYSEINEVYEKISAIYNFVYFYPIANILATYPYKNFYYNGHYRTAGYNLMGQLINNGIKHLCNDLSSLIY